MIKSNKTHFPRRNPIAIHSMQGFSLIEFLVASILSMIVLIAVGSGYFVSRQLGDTALARLSVQQDLRNASNMIVRDARMAGSFGCFNMATHGLETVSENTNDHAAIRLTSDNQANLIPIKEIPSANFTPANFVATSNALVFQYGIGSASISDGSNVVAIPVTVRGSNNDPLQNIAGNTPLPLVFSSCDVLDRPQSYTVAINNNDSVISNVNPALSAGHVANEFSVLRYVVNAYVIGRAGGQQGLFRFELGNNGQWSNPQLLMLNVNSMNIQYGYVNNCATTVAANETFEFTNTLKTDADAVIPALIRITLNNGNDVAATTAAGANAGNVYIYNIDATVRGGNICADRSI